MLLPRLFLPLLAACLANAEVFNLAGLHWTLKSGNGSIVVPGSLPSQAHLDLARAGVITEPLLGINDFTQRWIVTTDWTYTANLAPLLSSSSFKSNNTRHLLVFYGLDTVVNITIGNQDVAWVNNEFRQYVFDVTPQLAALRSPGNDNTNLTLAFESAFNYGLNVSRNPGAEIVPLLKGPVTLDFEYPDVRQWIRKIQDDFGWDWGPAFVPAGVIKPAYIVTLTNHGSSASEAVPASGSTLFIEEKSIEIYKEGQVPSVPPDQSADWIVNVTLVLRSSIPVQNPSMRVSFPELHINSGPLHFQAIGGNATSTLVSASFKVKNGVPQLWYPHNLGNPKRYNMTVSLSPWGTSFTTTTGFRTVVLVQSPYTDAEVASRGITPGDNFHFEINGQPFYSSGTNLIPFDPFYARIKTSTVRWILESAVAGGLNMIRVWGGGMYQPSDEETGTYNFYEICDELGIFAWSEFIFSDTLYPINQFLLDNIEPEVRQNVRRINRHPSNVQWAGGNEIEGIAISANQSMANGTHYLDEFVFLFQDFLHDITLSETHSTAYTDCSTTNGYLTLNPYVLRFLNETPGHIYGNSERYNYDASQAFDYGTYPVSRFVNEFGFHSMPSFYSWEEVLESPDDFNFNSTVVVSRDHHPPAGDLQWPNPNAPQGQGQMTQAVELWLPTPGTSDSNQTFAQWCWSTQIFQSLNMISEVAFYRRGAGRSENNLGALVWQLNDIWQGISWATIEYSGRWKVPQYGLTGAFAPVMIYPYWTASNSSLEVTVVSDRLEPVTGTAQLTWYDWTGKELNRSTHSFTTPALNNSVIFSAVGLNNILPAGASASDAWLRMNITAKTKMGTVVNEQYFNPITLAKATLVDPEISVTAHSNLEFTLSAKGGVGAFTWLDHPRGTIGYFIDTATKIPTNGFHLIPGQDRTLRFLLNSELSTDRSPDPAAFVLRSLWNNTHL